MKLRAALLAPGLIVLLVAFLGWYGFHRHNLSERCWHGGGPSLSSPYFPGEDDSRVDVELTWLPLGHECAYWNETHTDALVVSHPDWPLTLLAATGAVIFLVGAVSAVQLGYRWAADWRP